MRHPSASPRRLAVALLLGWVLAGDRATLAQSPAPAVPSPDPAFRVEKLSITAPELAEVLGYKFFGYAWHFSAPTYVRLRVRQGSEDAAPVGNGHPPQSFIHEDYHPLAGPLSEISVHLIEKQTDDGERPSSPKDEQVGLSFHLGLEGVGAGKGLPEPTPDGTDAALAALLPKDLVDQAGYTQS